MKLTNNEKNIVNEDFTVGRIYTTMGEKETPSEIYSKLIDKCEKVKTSSLGKDFINAVKQQAKIFKKDGNSEEVKFFAKSVLKLIKTLGV